MGIRTWRNGSGSEERRRSARAWTIGLAIGLLLMMMGLAHLRVETTRLRYRRATALHVEASLREEERLFLVELARLRDPTRLEREAKQRGFAPPDQVVRLPSVAAGPGTRGGAPR